MSDFRDAIANMVAKEAVATRTDPDRMAAMIECLASALGTTVAIASRGDPEMIDTLMSGAEAYAMEEAVGKSAIVSALGRLVR